MISSRAQLDGRWPSLGFGVGLRSEHYQDVLDGRARADWFEAISENYMDTGGRPLHVLEHVRRDVPVALHGVALSIGSTDPLDREYLRELRALRDRIGARWVSDHLCWTGVASKNTHDLLPMPFTEEALRHVADRVRAVQDHLGAPLVLENPSSYVEFAGSTMREWEFLAALAEEADCGLLLDVNNVFVSAFNHGFDPRTYLAGIPYDRVVQIHVAGHTRHATHIVDTHVGPVPEPVWDLLGDAYRRGCRASILLEWDTDIPPFEVVHAEARRAEKAIAFARGEAA